MCAKSKSAESLIEQELPKLLKKKPEFRYKIYDIIAEHFPPREEFREWLEKSDARFEAIDRRFEEMLNELRVFREETNKRFETMDKRFEAMDRRFEAMDKRFEAMDKRFEAMESTVNWLAVELSPLMSRVGKNFENVVRGIIGKNIGYVGGVVEKLIVKDEYGEEVEVDAYVHDKMHVLYEIKSRLARKDAYDFYQRAKKVEKKLALPTKKVIVCFAADVDGVEYCKKNNIEIISPQEEAIRRLD